jgi:hypothetical protein
MCKIAAVTLKERNYGKLNKPCVKIKSTTSNRLKELDS